MKLSKNFYLSEMTSSRTADRYNIKNIPDKESIENLKKICVAVLQPLRDYIKAVLTITSGYRSRLLNKHKDVGGSKTSHHLFGKAVDIKCNSIGDALKLANMIIELGLPYTQLILEFYHSDIDGSGWVHISYDENNLKMQKLYAVPKKYRILRKNKRIYIPCETEYFDKDYAQAS